MKFAKILAIVMALALCVGCLAGCGGKEEEAAIGSIDTEASEYTENNTEFVIGFSGPLTGGAAVYGTAVKNAAQMAVDEINAAGGLDGVKFKLVATDDQHDPTKVETNFNYLLESGMQISLGTVTTGPGLEFSDLADDENLFFLTPSASGDDIPAPETGFQMCFADGNQGAVAAKFVNENYKGQTIGAFYKSDDAYSNGIYEQFKANLDSSITVVESEFTEANTTNFNAQITKLKSCKLIFMPIYYQPASTFMLQAKDLVAADAVYYGCDGFDGLAGYIDTSEIPQEITMLSHFDSNAKEGAAADFIKKYTEKYGTDTLNQFGASAYDCVYAIYNAMKEAKTAGQEIPVTIGHEGLSAILKAKFTDGFTYSGVTGQNIKWQANGYVDKGAVKYVIKEANK